MQQQELNRLEIDLVLEVMYRRYGYDFRDYARSSLERRLIQQKNDFKLDSLSEMLPRIMHDAHFVDKFLKIMSVTVTDLFRDPLFFKILREKVVPQLKTYPYFKVWHAGCATGEEVYSMAILLNEEGLADRYQLYATDYNSQSLHTAEKAIYPLVRYKQYQQNHKKSGGKKDLADYVSTKYDNIIIKKELKQNIVFSEHNLVTDGMFGEMNIILCRNVMIYFNKDLKNSVIYKLFDSLRHNGFFCLGSKEFLGEQWQDKFEPFTTKQNIFRKKV